MSTTLSPSAAANPLLLAVLSGPAIEPIVIQSQGPALLGRARECSVRLEDPSVSRRHCLFAPAVSGWTVRDEGSRAGTFLNGVRLSSSSATPLLPGDRLNIGPWIFRVGGAAGDNSTMLSMDPSPREQSVPIVVSDTIAFAQQRLRLLMRAADEFNRCADVPSLARCAVEIAREGSGFTRAIMARSLGDMSIEVMASAGSNTAQAPSRTIIRAAEQGQAVRLAGSVSALGEAVSIISMKLRDAVGVPVRIDGQVDAVLYLDSDDPLNQAAHADSDAFAQAIAELCGAALGNLQRRALAQRQHELETEISQARAVQERLLPRLDGTDARIRGAVHSTPGRQVAGDLAGVLRLDAHRVAVYLGDVAGKGAAAGLLMAFTQARLEAALEHGMGPADAVAAVNRAVSRRVRPGEFVTLFLGVLDRNTGSLEFVDAGHGLALVVDERGSRRLEADGGFPIGVDESAAYEPGREAISASARLVVFSDGVVEQSDPDGRRLGYDAVIEALARTDSCERDVDAIVTLLRGHARGDVFEDDVTILAVE